MTNVHVELSPAALRRALDLLDAGHYESLDALVEALILGKKRQPSPRGEAPAHAEHSSNDEANVLAHRPSDNPPVDLVDGEEAPGGQLQFLTNRLNPIKLTTRALANLAEEQGTWPTASEIQLAAANLAREQGQRLRAEDERARLRGSLRRWVAYPVSEEAKAAIDRFIFSFTLSQSNGAVIGPLPTLGLAGLIGDRVGLTAAGWQLAQAPSPLLDGVGEGTLSDEEVAIFRTQLLKAPDERAAVAEFLRAVRRSAGSQPSVDHLLGAWHREWSGDRAAAERAAMVGRLGELKVLRVLGRGKAASIELIESTEFEDRRAE